VLATARDIKSLADLSERYGDQVKLFALDVTDEAAAANAVMSAIDLFGSLDVVVNNAGYGNLSSVEDTPLSEFRAQIETNLFGTIIVTKADLRYFREKKAGQFIQFSSVGGAVRVIPNTIRPRRKRHSGLAQVRHRMVEKPPNPFRISSSNSRVYTTFAIELKTLG
jgi:NAD(P)-dependent dehydrogenase (short-subunit alcohol dehydrogenase family)